MPKYFAFLVLPFLASGAYADEYSMALNQVRTNCSNISGQLENLKKMAGINTAITGVGTAAGAGATIAGIAKAGTDSKLEQILSPLKSVSSDNNPSLDEVLAVYDANAKHSAALNDVKNEISNLNKQSRTLGNVRTGLLGASTATNIAGAVIASKNKVDDDLYTQIDNCVKSVNALENSLGQARMDGVDITNAQQIVLSCGKWRDVDLHAIDSKSNVATWSSVIGAGTGLAGTITSAAANSNSVRYGDDRKEKNLNSAANVLAGGTTIASGVSTVFNATQISAVKKVVAVAQDCEEALK